MELKILGTVSPYPKNNHNCPAYLVREGDESVLLDCGNSSIRLLDMTTILNNLTVIISHFHKDHYGDLLSLMYATFTLHNLGYLKERVKVYLPKSIKESNEEIMAYNFLTSETLHYMTFIEYDESTIINLNNLKISFSKNPHPITTYAAKLENDKEILVYSSDTGYENNTLTRFAKGSNILLCESTFLKDQAKKTDYHLYAHEAATIAKTSGVGKLILTHFWPEIPSSNYQREAIKIFPNTVSAKEGMTLKLSF